jgi:hypothetical protein
VLVVGPGWALTLVDHLRQVNNFLAGAPKLNFFSVQPLTSAVLGTNSVRLLAVLCLGGNRFRAHFSTDEAQRTRSERREFHLVMTLEMLPVPVPI